MIRLNHYLLVYRPPSKLTVYEFGDDLSAAVEEYGSRERAARDSDDQGVQIILVGSDSLDTVRQTHAHYFGHDAFDLIVRLRDSDSASIADSGTVEIKVVSGGSGEVKDSS